MTDGGTEWTDGVRASLTSSTFVVLALWLLHTPNTFSQLASLPVIAWGGLYTLKILGQSIPFVSPIRLAVLGGYVLAFILVFFGGWRLPSVGRDAPVRVAQPARQTLPQVTPSVVSVPSRIDTVKVERQAPLPEASVPPVVENVPAQEVDPQASRPPPQIVPPPEDPTSDIRELLVESRKAEMGRDLDGAMQAYAESVEYFGKRRTNTQVRQDKSAYFLRWPTLFEEINPESIEVSKVGRNQWKASFLCEFFAESGERKAWLSGLVMNHYTFEANRLGQIKIIEQVGEVLNTSSGQLQPSNP